VLAAQGMAMVNLGTHYVKIVPDKEAHLEPGPTVELKPEDLPDSSSFLIYIVKLRRVAPSQAAAALAPFAKLPNSIVTVGTGKANRAAPGTPLPNLPAMLGLQDHSIVILRDYSSNVRRMLQVLEKMEQN